MLRLLIEVENITHYLKLELYQQALEQVLEFVQLLKMVKLSMQLSLTLVLDIVVSLQKLERFQEVLMEVILQE